MRLIPVEISSRQASKLKKGHPVRIKKGKGFNLIVSPMNYNLATRAFAKNKGVELKLTPEELEANKSLSPEQHEQLAKEASDMFGELPFAGQGLFAGGRIRKGGDIWDKLGDKAIDVGFDIMRKKLGLGLFASPSGGGLIEDLNDKFEKWLNS